MKRTYNKRKGTTSGFTIGLDLGDRRHHYCVLGDHADPLEEDSIANTRESLSMLAKGFPGSTAAMEAGTHSPWVSRHLESCGMRVIVANPRKLRAVYENQRKCDRQDAQTLARLARSDEKLLHPVHHGSEEAQKDMLMIKLRDSMVRARTSLFNAIRTTLKSLGYKVSKPSAESLPARIAGEVPPEIREMIAATLGAMSELTARIKTLDREILQMGKEKYPQTMFLQQVGGVGPITSLYYVLKIEDPRRFEKVRDVGAFLGLCPRRDQSGDTDKQLRISKSGDRYLRRLLVSAAQYTLGPFGPESALRDYGLKLAASGGPRAKKRAIVAVARKLSVLLLSLWRNQEVYEPYPETFEPA